MINAFAGDPTAPVIDTDLATESFPARPRHFKDTLRLPLAGSLLVISKVAASFSASGMQLTFSVMLCRAGILNSPGLLTSNTVADWLSVTLPIKLPDLPIFLITSVPRDDVPVPMPTALKLTAGATLIFAPSSASGLRSWSQSRLRSPWQLQSLSELPWRSELSWPSESASRWRSQSESLSLWEWRLRS